MFNKYYKDLTDKVEDFSKQKNTNWHISTSADGKYILTFKFNYETQKFIIHEFDEKGQINEIKSYEIEGDFENNQKLQSKDDIYSKWMLAISNCIDQEFVFVAISCVSKFDMLVKTNEENETENLDNLKFTLKKNKKAGSIAIGIDKDENQGNNINEKQENEDNESNLNEKPGKTVIYKISLKSENNNYEKVYESKLVDGIYRFTYCEDNLKDLKHFNYPRKFMIELDTLYKTKTRALQLKNCVFDHYFYTVQYKGSQVMQLYDLKTMQIQQIFNIHENLNIYKKQPILAISKNKQMIAFSPGYRKLTLYLIESGLEINSKDFGKNAKIIDCQFKNNDLLMIIIKKPKKYEEILFWNLYDSELNRFQPCTEEINSKITLYTAKIPNELALVKDDGSILLVYDNILKSREEIKPEISNYSILIHMGNKSEPNEMYVECYKNKHTIFHHIELEINEQLLKHNKEPWVKNDFKRNLVFFNKNGSSQLYIGSSTIQVWSQKKENLVLEYIWANNIKEDCEVDNSLKILELKVDYNNNSFYLKIKWNEFTKEIQWPYKNQVITIEHACNTLEHLFYRQNKLVKNNNQYALEEIKHNISFIIWKFIKNNPTSTIWRLMDVRYNLMAKIIIGGPNNLIKYILFGDEKVKNKNLHIPRITRYVEMPSEESNNNSEIDISKSSDLEIAIELCKPGLEYNNRILVVTYLLKYYIKNATKHPGWLITISKALPTLYTYKLEYYARKLFYKRYMKGIEMSNIIDYSDIIPKNIQDTLNANAEQKFQAFSPISELISTSNQKDQVFPNPSIKIVPLYNFTTTNSEIFPKENDINNSNDAKNLSQFSPLVQIIRLDKNNDIFNNPAIEAAINYKWPSARNYFLRLFSIYILFAICFAHLEATEHLCNFLLFLIIIFYYSGCYLLVVELMQLWHHSWRHYINDIFNFVDLASVILALIIMSVHVVPSFSTENAFANIVTTKEIVVAISFTMLLLWFEFILYLRLFGVGLSHTFLLLLQYPDFINLSRNTSNESTDNPAKDIITSFLSRDWNRPKKP
ncbi:unnamed protein product [Rhizophagus irregularis]|nr:unnamed protein product [Rhizophagus irregularis]